MFFENDHKLHLETLGDWGIFNGEIKFLYKYMYISCDICKKDKIVN